MIEAKWTYSSVWSRETIPQVDTRTAAPRVEYFCSRHGFCQLNKRAAQPGPQPSSVGADGRFRSIIEACRETDRIGRSKVSLKAKALQSCGPESTKTFARPRSRGGARGPRESSR